MFHDKTISTTCDTVQYREHCAKDTLLNNKLGTNYKASIKMINLVPQILIKEASQDTKTKQFHGQILIKKNIMERTNIYLHEENCHTFRIIPRNM
jgi:hypothetical protein